MKSLEEQVETLRADVERLEEEARVKASEKTTNKAQDQAQMFLEVIFAPFMDGACSSWGLSPEAGLRALIEEEVSLGRIANENPKALNEFINQPELQGALNIAKSLGDASDEWIKEKMDVLLEVMVKIRPSLARGIVETSGGREWFYNSLIELRDILFGVPKLSQETV